MDTHQSSEDSPQDLQRYETQSSGAAGELNPDSKPLEHLGTGAPDELANREGLEKPDAPTEAAADTPNNDLPQQSPEAQAEDTNTKQATGSSSNAGGTGVTDEEPTNRQGFLKRNRKRLVIGGAFGGLGIGLGVGGMFLYTLLLPMKVVSFIELLQQKFAAAPAQAVNKMTENIINHYISDPLLKGMYNNTCTDSVTRDCVPLIEGETNNPVRRLFTALHKQRFENKLSKYGLEFKRDLKTGQVYMLYKGNLALDDATLRKVAAGETTIYDELASGKTWKSVNPGEVRQAFREASMDETLVTRGWNYLVFGKGMEKFYGVTRCILACNVRDKLAAATKDAKKAVQVFFAKNVVAKIAPRYAEILLCIIEPGGDGCGTTLENSKGTIKQSPFQRALVQRLDEYAAQLAAEAAEGSLAKVLSKGVSAASDIFEKGLAQYIVDATLKPLIGEAADKFLPVVGWVALAAAIVAGASRIGPILQVMGYAVNAAAAVNTYMMYATLASEVKSGHTNAAAVGSFTEALSTNMSGSSNQSVDATATPFYAGFFGGGVDPNKTSYRCDDGSKVQTGQLVCPEEKLNRGNDVANQISSIVNAVPGLGPVADVINTVANLPGQLIGGAFTSICQAIPPCNGALATAGQYIGQFAGWLVTKLIGTPISDAMSGGRTFDMMAAGADVAYNKSCEAQLGCAKLTDQQVADIRNQATAEQKADFERRPLFAKLFSTDTPYSIASQVAIVMPTNLTDASRRFANLMGNPLNAIASVFSDLFAGRRVFAASGPIADPFGVIQYGYMPNQIPADPEGYWDKNCQGDQTDKWYEDQQEDPTTGEPVATKTNPCLLIQETVHSAAFLDTSLAPTEALTPDP